MNDIRRNFLWVVFAMSLVLLWDAWNKHNGEPTLFGAPIAAPVASAASGGVPASAAAQPGTAAPAVAAAATPANGPGEQVVLTTDVLRLTLASRGGDVMRAELLAYPDDQDKTQPVVLMDSSAQRTYLAQTGFIGQAGAAGLPNHFTLLTAQAGERTLKDGADVLSVVFASPEANGVQWIKTITLHRGQYAIDVKNELRNTGAAAIDAQIYLQLQRDGTPPPGGSSFYSTFTGPAIYSDEKKFQKVEFSDIAKRKAGDSPGHITKSQDGWVAMIQHYFTSAWLVNTAGAREFVTKKDKDNLYSVALVQPLGSVAPGASASHQSVLYVGPQEENKLAALAPGLELVKDYGVLHILAKPLFWVLDQLHTLIGNWGWAIVGLVVLLKIAFYWLNASAYKSMAKMKAVNPRIQELRERMKDKPQEMQQEMMRIYREEKVNPFGGCLPIFIQMPFFMALYWVLMATVEMRGAPWIWWIHDLAAIDPYYILPAVMTATSLLQVWLGPKAGDEMQQKMMWMMPLIFGVMFFFFPAGLVLYWLTNNILSIAQQWFINKRLGVN